jgi:signal peptidase II
VTSFFNVVRVHNSGAAFSFLAGAWLAALVFHRIGVVRRPRSCGCCAPMRGSACSPSRWPILGGAVGNVVDRVLHGYVVDFLDFYYGGLALSRRSTSPTAPSPSGLACLILDELLRVRRAR